MSTVGATTVLDELARREHRVIDTDEAGWIVEGRTANGPEPLWNLDRVRALLDEHRSGRLFVAGCVANQGALYDRFDTVVLLSAPVLRTGADHEMVTTAPIPVVVTEVEKLAAAVR